MFIKFSTDKKIIVKNSKEESDSDLSADSKTEVVYLDDNSDRRVATIKASDEKEDTKEQ